MHPVIGERLAEGNRLGAFVLVMWKAQILTTAVQVEALAEKVEAHHHAFAVPAGTSITPW